MPILVIYGVPEKTEQQTLKLFSEFMKKRVADIEELGLKKEDVSVFFPKDMLSRKSNEEIIIFVEGLTDKPERTAAIRRILASELVDEVYDTFSKTKLVECFVRPFNVNNGFCVGNS